MAAYGKAVWCWPTVMAYIMENSTHLGTHAPKDACASSAVYDETLKAAVKVISGALTNEESVLDYMDHITFGCAALIRPHACVILRPQHRSSSLLLLSYVYVWMQCTIFRSAWDCKEQQKSWKWVEWISRQSVVCALSYAKTICSAKAHILKCGYTCI